MIIVYLTCGALNRTVAASQPLWENETHSHGVTDGLWIEQDHYPNRHNQSAAANLKVGAPRTVRMIYFLPNDRPYNANTVKKMKDVIFKLQTFFAEQMKAHGYGQMTFAIEVDNRGKPVVHRVDGRHPDTYYRDTNPLRTAFNEINQVFDLNANVYIIIFDSRVAVGAGGRKRKNGGTVMLPRFYFPFHVIAHELGHAFGLNHDFRDGAYIMSYGAAPDRLSACAAEFLSVHPYFNRNIPTKEGEPPTIELISPHTYPAGSQIVSVQLKVNDSNGIHQLFLSVDTVKPHSAAGIIELKMCHRLAGVRDTVVQFSYDGVIPSRRSTSLSNPIKHPITVEVVDKNGDVGAAYFDLVEISRHHSATLTGHTRQVYFVSFSSDGTLASVSGDGTVKLWDVVIQKNITTLRVGGSSVAFSPDGITLASGVWDGTVELWDVTTQKKTATLERHTEGVESVAFSHDGRLLASGSRDGRVKLWDVTTQKNIATLAGHTDRVGAVVFSPDGATLASSSSDNTVKLWNVLKQKNIATFTHTREVDCASFSPDGRLLATGARDGRVKLWNVVKLKNIATLKGHTSAVNSVAFSPAGRLLATGSDDATIKLWDVMKQRNITTFAHTAPVESVALSPDGRLLAAGSWDNTVELWDMSKWVVDQLEPTSKINIPDPNLRAAIEKALSKASGDTITLADMQTLTALNARDKNIRNLTGLEYATKLKVLNLGDNSVSNISALTRLTNLETLGLARNSITDISPVARLTNLRKLNFRSNAVSDISPVVRLTNLTSLWLNGNSISDISPLAKLRRLTELRLDDNSIFDISPLVANTGLGNGDEVNLKKNPLSNQSINTHIPALQSRGVTVEFDDRVDRLPDKITGPWLWLIAPTAPGQGGANSNNIDSLAAASNGGVTEAEVAANGAREGDVVGNYVWTLGKIAETGRNNINDLVNAIGLARGDVNDHSSYALITLESVTAQSNVTMHVGSDDSIKVWLNGEVVHNSPINRGATDFQDKFTVNLKQGDNLLLVKVSERIGGWSMFVGIDAEVNAIYKSPPDTVVSVDVNRDGVVNIFDLVAIVSELGKTGANLVTDVNRDGIVNILDLVMVASMFGDAPAAPASQLQVPETITAVEVRGWLTDASALEIKDPIMKRGRMVLEQLLAALTPTETELLVNYPNPFNPETWIPYRLAEDAFVTLTIYDQSGQVVRTIDVGHQTAAVYESRSKAVYWDGQNGVGEQVASGVYFYTLSAGDYSATRKMVILK